MTRDLVDVLLRAPARARPGLVRAGYRWPLTLAPLGFGAGGVGLALERIGMAAFVAALQPAEVPVRAVPLTAVVASWVWG